MVYDVSTRRSLSAEQERRRQLGAVLGTPRSSEKLSYTVELAMSYRGDVKRMQNAADAGTMDDHSNHDLTLMLRENITPFLHTYEFVTQCWFAGARRWSGSDDTCCLLYTSDAADE